MDDLTGFVEESCRHAARSWRPRITLNQNLCRAHGSKRLDSEAKNCLRYYHFKFVCEHWCRQRKKTNKGHHRIAFSDHVMHDYPSLIATA